MIAWLKRLFGKEDNSTPKADIEYSGGKLKIKSYNSAFVDDLRKKHGDLTEGKTDAEVVTLFVDRENLEHEEPKLSIVHWGIEPDGKVRMELDWNSAFIRLLKEQGITGETDEDAVNRYLNMIRPRLEDEEQLEGRDHFTREQIDAAFSEIDAVTAREAMEAEAVLKKAKRKPRRRRVT